MQNITNTKYPNIPNTYMKYIVSYTTNHAIVDFEAKFPKCSKFTLGAKQNGWFVLQFTLPKFAKLQKGALSTWRACESVVLIAPLILHNPTSNVQAPIKLTPLSHTP